MNKSILQIPTAEQIEKSYMPAKPGWGTTLEIP
jgi:hypothetical protein